MLSIIGPIWNNLAQTSLGDFLPSMFKLYWVLFYTLQDEDSLKLYKSKYDIVIVQDESRMQFSINYQ